MPNPQPNQIITTQDGSRVRLQGPHAMDASVWIAHHVEGGDQTYVSADYLRSILAEGGEAEAAAVIPVPAPARRARVTPAEALSSAPQVNADELEDIHPEDRPARVRRAPRLICPSCEDAYTGVLGVAHACTGILSIRCKSCRSVNVQHLDTPPRPPYLCTACVGRGVSVCKVCAQPQQQRGRYHGICNTCNPLPEENIWAALAYKAQGNEMTIETKSHKPFAVEVECFRMPNDAVTPATGIGQGWEKVNDGSIRPDPGASENAEFRSPPLKGDGGLAILRTTGKKIRDMGYRANKSCGMHVHVDMISSSEEDRQALYRFGMWIQDDIYKLVAKSRADVQFCRKLTGAMASNDRYRWMNLVPAYQKHRTVEFRIHHGTTQPDRIVEWVKVCLRIVEAGYKLGRMTSRPSGSMFSLLGFNQYEKEYWMDVARSLHGADVAFTGV